jgi:photosystem II stability/assembly factor-like uncharacterized protein
MQGGRIETITCPPGYTSEIYVGVGSGNVWKSVNNGTTWKPIFEDQSTFPIGAIAVSPSDPDIVWVGTGEVLMARSSFAGTGVFKSTNGGGSWQHMGLPDSHHIGRVLVDPEDADVVYVAALGHLYSFNEERGLFKTSDGGRTWEKSLYISERVGVVDVIMDPSDRETLYAIAWERDRKAWNNVESGAGSGIYKSVDAGNTWERLQGGLPTGPDVGRMGLAVAASNPEVLYALVDNQAPDTSSERSRRIGGEVYRSGDRGASWAVVNQERLPTAIGYDFCLVRVSPDDEDQIYVLGNYLLHSDDGGKTYRRNEGAIVNLLPHESKVLHLDHHELWIDPLNPDRLLLGTDGGLYTSHDRGETWLRLNNLPIAEVYAVSLDLADPYNVYIGTQDDAALVGPSTATMDDVAVDPWRHIYLDRWGGGDSYFTYVDPTDPDTVYYEHQFGDLRRKNMETGETRGIRPRVSRGEEPLRRNWMTPYFISHYDPSTLYYGANKLFKSLDRGDSWTVISPDLTTQPGPERQGDVPFGTTTSISESTLAAGMLYVGSDDGSLRLTRDDGKSWTDIRGDLPQKWVSRVVASEHDQQTVYVSLTGYREDDFGTYLYRSTDLGTSWSSIAGNLPAESVNVIREDPTNRDILYVGTDLGIYVSLDRGGRWHSLCAGLPTVAVQDIAVHPREGELVIGTHGRSVYLLDLAPIREAAR